MSFSSIASFFNAFKNLKILVIGDVMIDAYIWGQVSRISPEAPVPVVNIKSREKRLGGAANVALNLQSLGVTPIICGVIGDDDYGMSLKKLFHEKGISDEGLLMCNNRITTVKERVLAGSQHLLRLDSEVVKPLSGEEEESLLNKISKLIPSCDAIIFEDYDKGTITPSLIKSVVETARKHSKPTVVDPKKNNFFAYSGVDLFKPNLKELQEGMHVSFANDDIEAISAQTAKLLKMLSVKYVMTTLSDKGVYIKSANKEFHIEAHKRSISDVSGAGDTVVSIAGICMALNMSAEFTASLANLGGGIVCEELGVVPISKQKLLSEAEKYKLKPAGA